MTERAVIIAVGRVAGPERELCERYLRRARPAVEMIELADGSGSAGEIRRREAALFRAKLPRDAFVVCLDQEGAALASATLAASLAQWSGAGRVLAFLIGGAEGLDRSLLDAAHARLSLGPQTWPHMLARVMLVEQLYRARMILAGHPYHRAERPK